MKDPRGDQHRGDEEDSSLAANEVQGATLEDAPGDDAPLRIAVTLPHKAHWANQVMRGVAAFARRKKSWNVQWLGLQPEALAFLATWKPDGILANLDSERRLNALSHLGVPIVDIQGAIALPGIPSVSVDHFAIGQMAADHFSRRGLRNFACLQQQDIPRDRVRSEGFTAFVRRLNDCQPLVYSCPGNAERPALLIQIDAGFGDWLISAPKPLGLFTVNDWLGLGAAQFCQQLGLRVPQDVAIVGADDDEAICQIADPMLSSVNSPLPQIGFEAAKILASTLSHRMLDQHSVTAATRRLLHPIGVTIRHSCDMCAVDDPEIAQALRLIYGFSGKPLGIADVLKRVAISRRALEQRFRAATGRSPMAEVRRMSMERAARMLIQTEVKIAEIGRDCGFESATHFSVAFARHHGMSPSRFRLEYRSGRELGDIG